MGCTEGCGVVPWLYLVLEQGSAEGPGTGKYKEELVLLPG